MREDVGIVGEGLYLDRVSCRVEEEHRPLLADLAARLLGRSLKTFEFRMLKPAFVDSPFYCVASVSNGRTLFQTLDSFHDVCTSALAD